MGIYSTPEPCNYRQCSEPVTRRYLNGWFCPDHTPAKIAGRDDIVPPALNLKRMVTQPGAHDYRAEYRQRRADRISQKRANRT